MKKKISQLLFLAILCIVLFITDICTFFWYQAAISYLLFSFLLCCSWYSFTPMILSLGLLLLATQALIINSGVLPGFLTQAALLFALVILRERLYLRNTIPALAFLIYYLIITYFLPLHSRPFLPESYTIMALFGNLIAIGIFSLKLKTSRTRQSLVPIA